MGISHGCHGNRYTLWIVLVITATSTLVSVQVFGSDQRLQIFLFIWYSACELFQADIFWQEVPIDQSAVKQN